MCRCVWLLVLVFLMYGCGQGGKSSFTEESAKIPFPQRSDLPKHSGGLVVAVGGDTITSNEIIGALVEESGGVVSLLEHLAPIAMANRNDFERFKRQAKGGIEEVLERRISNVLLYRQAKEDAPEQIDVILDRAAEDFFRGFVEDKFEGDYGEADAALREMGMDRASFKEYRKKMFLVEYHIQSQLPKAKPTHSELLGYYDKIKDRFFAKAAMLKLQLLDIEVARVQITDPNQDQLEQAIKLAGELIKQIQDGNDFGELAEEHPGVEFGAHTEPVQAESLIYPELAPEANEMEPGDITLEPIKTRDHEHVLIMKLEEKHAKKYAPFEQVQREVEKRFTTEREILARQEIRAKVVRQAAVKGEDDFIDFCLRRIFEISHTKVQAVKRQQEN